MRLTDKLLFPIAALWQQASRTVLTTLGVMFGAFVLAASISINQGVQETINRESHKTDALRRITVYPRWNGSGETTTESSDVVVEGKMSEEKRKRIQSAIAIERSQTSTTDSNVLLTHETLHRLAEIPHVERVEPGVGFLVFATLNEGLRRIHVASAAPRSPVYEKRIVAGRYFQTADEHSIVVNEYLLYRCGIIDDSDVEALIGRKIRLEIRNQQPPEKAHIAIYLIHPNRPETTAEEVDLMTRLNQRIPEMLMKLDLDPADRETLIKALGDQTAVVKPEENASAEFTLCGVLRRTTDEENSNHQWWEDSGGNSEIYLPYQACTDFYEQSPSNRRSGVHQTLVVSDHEDHVKEILKQVKQMGLNAYAPIEYIERERLIWRLVFGGMTCVAAVALLVAAMGIANTMLMSVLERTREIGIMKSVGATNADVQLIFLVEGALIGLIGGTLGILLAWIASLPGDSWVRSMVQRDMNVRLKESLFVFPPWLLATVIVFSIIVSTIAAVYPARRAARIDPVTALRHD